MTDMDGNPLVRRTTVCPYVNKSDTRCANHWTLRNLCQAFTHCADQFAVCPVYRALHQELIPHGKGSHKDVDSRLRVLAAC